MSYGIHDYVIQQERQSFCPNGGRLVEIVVRADTIFSISSLDTIQLAIESGPYLTVDGLFQYIIEASTRGADEIQVTYNERYGYPERIFVDWIAEAIDDENAYRTLNFRAIRP